MEGVDAIRSIYQASWLYVNIYEDTRLMSFGERFEVTFIVANPSAFK